MQIVVLHRPQSLLREQIIIHKRLGGLRRKLHHHTRRGIGIHICVLACHIVRLRLNDLEEHLAGLCLAGNTTAVTICDVALCHLLAGRLHKLHLDHILNILHRDLLATTILNSINNFIYKDFILTVFGRKHRLTYGGCNLLAVKTHNATISFYYSLYHIFNVCIFSGNIWGKAHTQRARQHRLQQIPFSPKVFGFSLRQVFWLILLARPSHYKQWLESCNA